MEVKITISEINERICNIFTGKRIVTWIKGNPCTDAGGNEMVRMSKIKSKSGGECLYNKISDFYGKKRLIFVVVWWG